MSLSNILNLMTLAGTRSFMFISNRIVLFTALNHFSFQKTGNYIYIEIA